MKSEFETRYRELYARGGPGWAGDNHQRSVLKDRQTLNRLKNQGLLPSTGMPALEMGCGNGALADWFSENRFRYLGIDISETAVAWAAECHLQTPGVKFQRSDIRALPELADGSVQLTLDSSCLHCLIGEDRDAALSEARRILAPDGIFIMSSMCGVPRELPDGVFFDKARSLLIREGEPYRSMKPFEDLATELLRHCLDPIWSNVSVNSWWDHATIVCRMQYPTPNDISRKISTRPKPGFIKV